MHKGQKKSVRKTIIIYVCIVIAVPLLLYVFVDLMEFNINNIPDTDWLAFWGTYIGAILGSLATLLGVVYTIKSSEKMHAEENEKYREDVKRQYAPFFVVSEVQKSEVSNLGSHMIELIQRFVQLPDEKIELSNFMKHERKMVLKVKNIGSGPAINVQVVYNRNGYKIDGFNDREIQGYYQKTSIDFAKDEEKYIELQFMYSDSLIEEKGILLDAITIELEYEDILNNKIRKPISLNLRAKQVMGYEKQIYVDKE